MKLIFFLLACTALVSAKINVNKLPHYKIQDQIDVSPRIVNGDEVEPHSRPYQVWLTVRALFQSWRCGGVLISEKYVLTAGHCGDGAISASVLLGAHDITKRESTQVTVDSRLIKVHENYSEVEMGDNDSAAINDISIIELANPVKLNENIQPVKLPSKKDAAKTYVGERARVSGWGLTKGNGDLSDVLNAEDSVIIEDSECEKTFYGMDFVGGVICMSGANNKSSCNGDSGGPLTTVDDDSRLIGLVSFGLDGCPLGTPDAFTRVNKYLDWIEKNSDVTLD